MFSRKSVSVSRDLKETAIPIFWICRIFGIVPASLNHVENTLMVKLSILQTIYSYCLGFITVGLAINGIVEEVNHIEINESTTKYVTVMQMIIVLVTIVIGIFGAPFRFLNICTFIKLIYEIDTLLPLPHISKGRNASIRAIMLTLLSAIISFTMKTYVMYTYLEGSWFANIRDTLFYCIVMIMECQYWYMTTMVQRRFHSLNGILANGSFVNNDEMKWQGRRFEHDIELFGKSNRHTNMIKDNLNFDCYPTITTEENQNFRDTFTSTENDWKLVKVYINLCNVVDNLNDCCGLFISIIILIDLLQLTVGGYFLIVELQSSFDIYYTILLCSMFLVYFYRLVFIVEPCEDTLKQVKRMNASVCKLLCTDLTVWDKLQMRVLYEQLHQRNIEFSAFGLGNIDRSIIATILANVTVYLVAVLQFKISED